MFSIRKTHKSFAATSGQTLVPPPLFSVLALLGIIGILLCIFASAALAPASDPMFHFSENGAITALSSISLAMASILALAIFYLSLRDWSFDKLFWFVLAGGCLFLSLDEQLQFHERGGDVIELTSIGASEFFRNWNDLIVIGYGFVALGVGAMFRREILRCRAFAAFFAIGFFFYAVHTGLDSILPVSVAWKDIPEEGSKLLSVFSLFLGTIAMFMALTEQLFGAAPVSQRDAAPHLRGRQGVAQPAE